MLPLICVLPVTEIMALRGAIIFYSALKIINNLFLLWNKKKGSMLEISPKEIVSA